MKGTAWISKEVASRARKKAEASGQKKVPIHEEPERYELPVAMGRREEW